MKVVRVLHMLLCHFLGDWMCCLTVWNRLLQVTVKGLQVIRVGQNRINIRCIYGIFGREITKYTVTYGVYIRFWPTLQVTVVDSQTGTCRYRGDHTP